MFYFFIKNFDFCSVDVDTKMSMARLPNDLLNLSHKQSQ